jgi:hypothetical protein
MRAQPNTSHRAPDWRDQSACRDQDPDLFAPDGTTGKWAPIIAHAKSICGRCTVQPECLTWALDTRELHGIFGGLTEDERWNLLRQQTRHARRPTKNPRGPRQPAPQTLQELLDRHTSPTTGGHLVWTGAKTPVFRERQLTANQLAFLVDRGREPDGAVHRTCGVKGCVQPKHLADAREKAERLLLEGARQVAV